MTTLGRLLDEVEAAPTGPAIAAFFDVDGTLVYGLHRGRLLPRPRSPRPGRAGGARALAGRVRRQRPARRRPGPARADRRGRPARAAASRSWRSWARRLFREQIAGMRSVPSCGPAARGAPGAGPHGRDRILGHALPGRSRGPRARRRARALQRGLDRGRGAHRPLRRRDALGRRQGGGGALLRARTRPGARPAPTPTPTGTRTSRCSPPSASRARSPPTRCSSGPRCRRAGRSCIWRTSSATAGRSRPSRAPRPRRRG